MRGALYVTIPTTVTVPVVGTLSIQGGQTGVVLGDSITGTYEWYAPLVTTVAGLASNVTFTNEGVGGNVLNQMLARIDDVIAHEPDFVFIEGGINDVFLGVSSATSAGHLTSMITELRAANPSVQIAVCGPWILGATIDQRDINQAIRATDTAMRNVAIAQSVTYVDWRLRYDVYFRAHEAESLTFDIDGVHPSAAGKTWLSSQTMEQVAVTP